jgi:hypothetical protein
MSGERKERNMLKLILIMRFACATLDVGHPITKSSGTRLHGSGDNHCHGWEGSRWRNVMHYVVDFVDTRTKKFVDFGIIEKQIGFIHGNYFGLSNGMEVKGVRRAIERWKVIPGLSEKVLRYVHNRDAKTYCLIKSIWGKPEFLDPNQVLKIERKT